MAMNVLKVPPLYIMAFPMPHSDPETGKGAEERPHRHAHGATHHEAHLHAVAAAWLGLFIGTHGYWHLRGSTVREVRA